MNDPLEKYRDKRDPGRTNEPFSAERNSRPGPGETWSGRFVIHQHAASRMHFDLRLQVGGTLQSFAVPRGISLDPSDKHLAIHTEDHPIDYLFFEDVIPEGNYGAGSMIVWDTGGVTFLEVDGENSLRRGKLDFVLSGFKARGRFALIATGRRKAATGLAGTRGTAAEWLLIKKKDASSGTGLRLAESMPRSVLSGLTVEELGHQPSIDQALREEASQLAHAHPPLARQAPLSQTPIVPMVCSSEAVPRRSPHHLYELKLDGVRIIATKDRNEAQLNYRSGRVATRNYADIARSVRHLPVQSAILDGEIVTFDELGRPSFQRLAPRIQARKLRDIEVAEANVPVVFMVFDVLMLDDFDLRAAPLSERKKVLHQLVRGQGFTRALDHIVERGDALFALCEQQGLEGMIAKRKDSVYTLGPKKSGDWVKDKREEDHDFVVVGFTEGKDGFRSLCLGTFVGDRLIYRGRVGGGFSDEERRRLESVLRAAVGDPHAIVALPADVRMVPIRLGLVVRVKSHGFTEEGHLRAPVYQGVRADREPRECTAGPNDERIEPQPPEAGEAREEPALTPRATRARGRVKLTNREKVFWPTEGFTKGDLLDYYQAVAPTMLPLLANRPVVLVRYPDGIEGKSFYQWRAPKGTPDWIATIELYDEEKQQERGSGKAAFLIDSVDALLYIANLGCIPVHILASREATREYCDFLTIDFDLGERPFTDGVRLALALRELLDELELSSFPKTSGQRGLHVLVPLGPGVTHDSSKLLCELLGRLLVGRHQDIATMERRIEKRGDKVYVDTGQTGRSRTIVAPYSVRAYPGARVSTPLRWEEVHLALDPAVFTIETVPQRIHSVGDPMRTLLAVPPDLPKVLSVLARWTS